MLPLPLLSRVMENWVATPGRALAECLALRRTVVPNAPEQKLKLSGLLTEIGYGAKRLYTYTGRNLVG